jgi:hypothetical protein
MPKYEVNWTEEIWFRGFIEADSKEEAYDIFWKDMPDGKEYGGEIQEGVSIAEVID